MFIEDAMSSAADSARGRMEAVPARVLERMLENSGPAPSFEAAIRRGEGPVRIIAEVKRASPSAGVLYGNASVSRLVAEYRRAGAAAVSILTNDMFAGTLTDLHKAGEEGGLPILRKDFISLEYQLLEARVNGASAALLISDALAADRLRALLGYAGSLGLDALVESHGREGLERAADCGARILGINNRDLGTLELDLGTTERLLPLVPPGTVVVSESGIRRREDVARMDVAGVDALLIGEELMRADSPGQRLKELMAIP